MDNELNKEQKKENKLFYDVLPFNVFDISNDDTSKKQKNQVVIFLIKDFKHIPLVSFCYEDVMSLFTSKSEVMEKIEIYDSDIDIKRDLSRIMFHLPTRYFPEYKYKDWINFTDDHKVHIIYDGKHMISERQQVSNIEDKLIFRASFNNYEYIEKTIIEEVQEHEDTLEQIVEQVKKHSSSIKKILECLQSK